MIRSPQKLPAQVHRFIKYSEKISSLIKSYELYMVKGENAVYRFIKYSENTDRIA